MIGPCTNAVVYLLFIETVLLVIRIVKRKRLLLFRDFTYNLYVKCEVLVKTDDLKKRE